MCHLSDNKSKFYVCIIYVGFLGMMSDFEAKKNTSFGELSKFSTRNSNSKFKS